MSHILIDTPYEMICKFYGEREAKRSKVPLINHINEGLIILDILCASHDTKDAYCLHPMLQEDGELSKNACLVLDHSPYTIMLAMEYRSVANEFLRGRVNDVTVGKIRLSPLADVNLMLIADKVQNRKDFEIYHKGTHPKSADLEEYFSMWLERLGVSEEQYQSFVKVLNERTN